MSCCCGGWGCSSGTARGGGCGGCGAGSSVSMKSSSSMPMPEIFMRLARSSLPVDVCVLVYVGDVGGDVIGSGWGVGAWQVTGIDGVTIMGAAVAIGG